MHVGFTGTQGVPSDEQLVELANILLQVRDAVNDTPILHHGDCIGADQMAHIIASRLGYAVILHPPTNKRKRAFVEGCKEVREPKQYLYRNKEIVLESELLVAVPKEDREIVRSGTWSTIRFAKKQAVPRLIVFPDGSISNQAPALLNALGVSL